MEGTETAASGLAHGLGVDAPRRTLPAMEGTEILRHPDRLPHTRWKSPAGPCPRWRALKLIDEGCGEEESGQPAGPCPRWRALKREVSHREVGTRQPAGPCPRWRALKLEATEYPKDVAVGRLPQDPARDGGH